MARYCSTHFPDFLKTVDKYKAGDLTQGLEDAFLDFDHTLTTADVKKQLKLLFNDGRLSSDDGNTKISNLISCTHVDVVLVTIKEIVENNG